MPFVLVSIYKIGTLLMKNYIVGNWKMNQSLEEINAFFTSFNEVFPNTSDNVFVGVSPQSFHIPLLMSHPKKPEFINIGAQNCSQHKSGAFTGENSPSALKEIGTVFTLIGHSERRQFFGETSNLTLGEKIQSALDEGLQVIYCIGESLQERKQNLTQSVLKEQTITALKDIKIENQNQLLIAYEPVWAIGTGETATPEQAEEAHQWIRGFLNELPNINQETPLLYGGSVKPENVDALLAKENINGALVGGASLKGDSFGKLCQAATK
jgi:triosephosphate isomerase